MTPRQKHQIAWLALATLVITVLVEATFPGKNEPSLIPHLDKFIHFTVYGAIGYLAAYVFTASTKPPRNGVMLFALVFVILLGITTEVIQSYTPNRDTSLADIIANTLGALTFLLVLHYQRTGKTRQD